MFGMSRKFGGALRVAAIAVSALALGGIMAGPSLAQDKLVILGSVPATLRILDRKSPVPGLDRHQLVGAALIPALAWALPTMLRGETVLTVIAILAGVALFLAPRE